MDDVSIGSGNKFQSILGQVAYFKDTGDAMTHNWGQNSERRKSYQKNCMTPEVIKMTRLDKGQKQTGQYLSHLFLKTLTIWLQGSWLWSLLNKLEPEIFRVNCLPIGAQPSLADNSTLLSSLAPNKMELVRLRDPLTWILLMLTSTIHLLQHLVQIQ